MLAILVTILHVTVCVILILVVLLQQGGKADLGVFGGAGTQTAFGGAGPATLLYKITIGAAAVFMLTCLFLTINPGRQAVDTDVTKRLPNTQPAKPAPAPQGTAPAPGGQAPAPQGAAPTPGAPANPPSGSTPDATFTVTPPPAEQPAGRDAKETPKKPQ